MQRSQLGTGVVVAAALVLAGVVLRDAWVAEDALITFRTIDNLVEGRGLRWNVDERVQTFTHPLWLLVNAAAYTFTREIYWTTTLLGLLGSVSAFAVLAMWRRERPMQVLLAILAPWVLSGALVQYSTSGFENSLTSLLVSLFSVRLLVWRTERAPPWLALFGLAGLSALNRLDTVLLFAPALLWLAVVERGRLRPAAIALGLSPLIAWLAFALVYYGSFVPNTALAKVTSAVPLAVYLRHGLLYALDLVQTDLCSALLLLAGGAIAVQAAARWARGEAGAEDRRLALLGGGAFLYALYVVRVGGGFLSGRFWTAPLLLSLVLLAARAPGITAMVGPWPWRRCMAVAAGVLLAAAAVIGVRQGFGTVATGVLPRSLAHVALDGTQWTPTPLAMLFVHRGREAARAAREGNPVSVQTSIGFTGIAAGPEVRIIDTLALADPLLARLPPRRRDAIEVGHLHRNVPKGYVEARASGSLDGMHPDLAAYYRQLRRILADPLWSRERLEAILAFQLGRHDALLERYGAASGRSALPRAQGAKSGGSRVSSKMAAISSFASPAR